jgi:hypothetical protein
VRFADDCAGQDFGIPMNPTEFGLSRKDDYVA